MTERPTILVIGAGSIGARHARNFLDAGASVAVMDVDRERATTISGATTLALDLRAAADFEGVVVASPTVFHAEHASAALHGGGLVLVEKPMTATAAEARELAARADGRLAVGFNLRFHEPVERAIQIARSGQIGTVSAIRVWFGHWLPAWRPQQDYRMGYSATRSLGGGVLLDAIHELDLLLWTLGTNDLVVRGAVVERLGALEIDVEDTVKAVLWSPSASVAADVSLDYLARRYRRGLEVTGALGTVRLDWARGVIEVEDGDGCIATAAGASIDVSYRRQDEAFLDWVRGGPPLPVTADTGAASVRLAEEIRGASR